jgi:hypothetical protein
LDGGVVAAGGGRGFGLTTTALGKMAARRGLGRGIGVNGGEKNEKSGSAWAQVTRVLASEAEDGKTDPPADTNHFPKYLVMQIFLGQP